MRGSCANAACADDTARLTNRARERQRARILSHALGLQMRTAEMMAAHGAASVPPRPHGAAVTLATELRRNFLSAPPIGDPAEIVAQSDEVSDSGTGLQNHFVAASCNVADSPLSRHWNAPHRAGPAHQHVHELDMWVEAQDAHLIGDEVRERVDVVVVTLAVAGALQALDSPEVQARLHREALDLGTDLRRRIQALDLEPCVRGSGGARLRLERGAVHGAAHVGGAQGEPGAGIHVDTDAVERAAGEGLDPHDAAVPRRV